MKKAIYLSEYSLFLSKFFKEVQLNFERIIIIFVKNKRTTQNQLSSLKSFHLLISILYSKASSSILLILIIIS